jgi:hypothetical protein
MIKKNYVVQERKKKNSNYNESGNEMKVERSSQHVCVHDMGSPPMGRDDDMNEIKNYINEYISVRN